MNVRARAVAAATVALLIGCSDRSLPSDSLDGAASSASPDATSASTADGVPCGGSTCDTSNGSVCCEQGSGVCSPTPCPVGVQSDACDGPEDCPGQTCCLLIAPIFGSACTPSCSNAGGQRGRVCHSDGDCAAGELCAQLEVAGGLKGCVPR